MPCKAYSQHTCLSVHTTSHSITASSKTQQLQHSAVSQDNPQL